jgi:hypothetical protein
MLAVLACAKRRIVDCHVGPCLALPRSITGHYANPAFLLGAILQWLIKTLYAALNA